MTLTVEELLSTRKITLIKELKQSATLRLNDCDEDVKISRGLYDKLITSMNNMRNFKEAMGDSFNSHCLNEDDITFGVELEFIGSKDRLNFSKFTIEMYHLLNDKFIFTGSYYHNDGNYWLLGKDGSIVWSNLPDSGVPSSPYGYELSSPKLKLSNEDDVSILKCIIAAIKSNLFGIVNDSCGTHIHVSFKQNNLTKDDILTLLSAYSRMESKIFDPIVPITRRRNRYCKKTIPDVREKYQKVSSRYCTFECLTNWLTQCTQLHFEFRQLEGTLDPDAIMYWVKLQSCILHDLATNIDDRSYLRMITSLNAFDILFYYDFDDKMVSFFIDRIFKFKSRTI